MLMDQLSVWTVNTPFRKWMLERWTQDYVQFFDDLVGKDVLEVGCGSGLGTKLIMKHFRHTKIVATDLDPRLISVAKKNNNNPAISFAVTNAADLPYRNDSFDGVFVYGALHHIPFPDWQKSLAEIYRVLRPEGKAFIREASAESFETRWGQIVKRISSHPYGKIYRRQELLDYLRGLGFKTLYEK